MKTKINKTQIINSYFDEIRKNIESIDISSLNKVIDVIINAYIKNNNIYIFGNGGSASIASHLACDLSKGTLHRLYDNNEKRLRVVSLTDNMATITAYANDSSYNNIFVQQLQNLVKKNDVIIAISGSGNSINIIQAVKYSKKIGAKTIAFTGFKNGGKLAKIADYSLIVNSKHYGPIEDIHSMIGHLITAAIANYKNPVKKTNKNKSTPFYIR